MIKIQSFIPLFSLWLKSILMFMFFAAGDGGFFSSLSSSDGPPLDAGDGGDGGEGGGESTETGKEPGAEPGAEVTEKPEDAEAADKGKAKEPPAPDLAKPLSTAAKSALKELKAANPVAWKELNNRLWALNAQDAKIAEHFDEGLEGAIKLKTSVDTFLQEADLDNLDQVKEEINGFRMVDAKLMKGDATFLNDLPAEMQGGLFKMMPGFAEEWRTRDNDAYQRYFSGLVVATLRDTKFQQNLEMALWKLEEMGVDDPGVKKIFDLLSGNMKWINDLNTKATTQPEKKAAAVDDENTREKQSLAKQSLQLARTRVMSKFRQNYDQKFMSTLKSVAGGTVPANVNKAEVMLKAAANLFGVLGSRAEQRIEEYLTAKDEEGAWKYLASECTDKRVTEAVSKAYRYLYGGTEAAKQAGDKGKEGKEKDAGGAPQFITLNYNPKPSSIDMAASEKLAKSLRMTRNQLFLQNKAVLKNGKKVTWSRDAEMEQ